MYSVRYYASLVDYYSVYKLKRMAKEMAQLYLLCFVLDRYQRLNDNLLTAFCALVAQYPDPASLKDRPRRNLSYGESARRSIGTVAC